MENNLLKDYLKYRLDKKEAAINPLGIAGKAGGIVGTLGSKYGLVLLLGIPGLLGVVGGLLASKIKSPTKADLSAYEKGEHLDSLNARIERLKKYPEAQYTPREDDRTLRI